MEKIYSRYYYPIEYYNPHAHLECNYNTIGHNEAEIKALHEEEYKNKYNQMKELKQKEYFKKYNKSDLLYEEEKKMKNKEEELIKKKEKFENLLKRKNYNKTVYQKNMKPFLKEREMKEKAKNLKKLKKSKSANRMQIKKNNNLPKNRNNNIEKEFNTIDNNYYNDKGLTNDIEINENKKTIDNLDDINKLNLNEQNSILNNNNIKLDNNVIDLRRDLENQLLEEIQNKNKIIYINNNGITDEVNEKIGTLKRFRSYGYLPEQMKIVGGKKKKKELKNKKFCSEFERRRYIKALKNIITERLGEHNIYIQNICSCGNLQKQLTALVEKGNFTVYALTEVECANNCVFYKNKKAYLKNINDVLKSIKDISYENFHNKKQEHK